MDRNEAEASFRILVAVARADGHIAMDEERALAILARLDSAKDIQGQVDVAQEAAKIRSPEVRRATFDAALALASVDGLCTPEEHALLTTLRTTLDIKDCPDVAVAEAAWLEKMKSPLRDLSDLEVRFLRAVALERDDMTDREYSALVSDFSRQRRSVLEEALEPAILG
jgi:tellurite resistance protein